MKKKNQGLENPNFLHLWVYFDLGFEVWLRFGISFFYFVIVVLCICFGSSMEEFGVKNELGFLYGLEVLSVFLFLTLAIFLEITWPLDFQIE